MSKINLKDSNDFFTKNLTEKALKVLKDKTKWRTDSPDRPQCAICGKIIDRGIPLRMWNDGEVVYEISFHTYCAFKEIQIDASCEYCKNWDPGENDFEEDCILDKFPYPDSFDEDDWNPSPDEYYCDKFEYLDEIKQILEDRKAEIK
ncbi:MAG: hypothetical protein ACFFDF_16110 [Candidatus Odinarchaeota archaeon]